VASVEQCDSRSFWNMKSIMKCLRPIRNTVHDHCSAQPISIWTMRWIGYGKPTQSGWVQSIAFPHNTIHEPESAHGLL
jgi:hypothetical protein